MKIKYTYSVVTMESSVIKQLQLDNDHLQLSNDPILMMQYVKDFLNDRLRQSKLKNTADLHVVDVKSVYRPCEDKFYFYVTCRYSIEEERESNGD